MLIEDQSTFEDLVVHLREEKIFCLDTEFLSDRSFRPKLCLLQASTKEQVCAIDPFRVKNLDSFLDLVRNPDITKVLHAGQQDMMIFFDLINTPPKNIFDTQIAAALLGLGDSIGYARLVESVLRTRLKQDESFTDWSQRPLTKRQVEYALDDVRHLPALHDCLSSQLEDLGRRDWLKEELAVYDDVNFYRRDPETAYRRLRGADKLHRANLAVLQRLAKWREEEAQRRDRPRSWIMPDAPLVELARRKPKNVGDLKSMRGLHPRFIKRNGDQLLRVIAESSQLGPESYPPPLTPSPKDPDLAARVGLLEVLLKKLAADLKIGADTVATRSQLYQLVRASIDGQIEQLDLPLLSGWRGKLVGQKLAEFLEGRLCLTIDRKTGDVVIHLHEEEGGSTPKDL